MSVLDSFENSFDLFDQKSNYFIHNSWPREWRQRLLSIKQKLPQLNAHVWVPSSGTSGQLQWISISKQSMMNAARRVNAAFALDSNDITLNSLPLSHVGGLMSFVRTRINKSQYQQLSMKKWCSIQFLRDLVDSRASLTSLVPTQIVDLVRAEAICPQSLKTVFVGADFLAPDILLRATKLGWPVKVCYGMTETCAMVAVSSNNKDFNELPGVKISVVESKESAQQIAIECDSLFSCRAKLQLNGEVLIEERQGDIFVTRDVGRMNGSQIQIIGRNKDFIKISGEILHLRELNNILNESIILLKPNYKNLLKLESQLDKRTGQSVVLKCFPNLCSQTIKKIVSHYNEQTVAVAKIKVIEIEGKEIFKKSEVFV